MDLMKAAVLSSLLCQLVTVCASGQSSSLMTGLVENDNLLNRKFSHEIAKRQVPWNCPICGYGSKQIVKEKENMNNKKSKPDGKGRHDSLKNTKAKKKLSYSRCKHTPDSAVCDILRKVLGGIRW